jgi:OOP family OmpA-OmpF porin
MPTGNLDQAFQALAALDAGTLLVNSGQVTISGRADDPAKAAVARDLAAAHSDTWNVFLDGQATGARFGAVKLPDGSILTSGDIPSEKMRETLLDLLRGGDAELRVTDRLNIHAEGLAEAWVENLMKGAKALAKLDWGSVSLDGDKAYLTGMADADQIGPISDDLGVDFTAELTPRSAKSAPGRISTLERELEAAKSRVLDLSAASAKHLADLNAADARADQLRKAGADADAEAQAAKDRISELEAAATKNQADLANANARIAGLTEMLSLRPADADDLHPADALPGPSRSSLEATGPTRQADAQRSQPAATDVPHEPTQEQTPPASAQAMPQAAPTDQPQQEAVRTAALSASQEAEHIAETCNAAINSMLKNAAITFESKSAQITREGNEVLDRLMAQAAPCVGNPALKVTVGGHTDSRGQDRDNLRLSKERADSVKESLIVRSIPPDAITAIGYGETMPIADNETEEGRSVNRRITIDWSLR